MSVRILTSPVDSSSHLGTPNSLWTIYPGYTQEATFGESIKYNLEIELKWGVKLFAAIEMVNPFNVRMAGNGDWGAMSYSANPEDPNSPYYLRHGFRAGDWLANAGTGSARNTPRYITLEAGLKF